MSHHAHPWGAAMVVIVKTAVTRFLAAVIVIALLLAAAIAWMFDSGETAYHIFAAAMGILAAHIFITVTHR